MSSLSTTRANPRWLIVSHRWLGLLIGPLVVLWCTSGAIMMYQGFPSLTETERLAGLAKVRDTVHAATSSHLVSTDLELDRTFPWPLRTKELTDAYIERLGPETAVQEAKHLGNTPDGRLVLRARDHTGTWQLFDFTSGQVLVPYSQPALTEIATAHQRNCCAPATVRKTESIERDQWTVPGRFDRHRPLQRVRFEDGRGSVLYISSRTGEVMQQSTTRERLWSVPGAVSHWLYLTALRRHPAVWSLVVIWTSILALFLIIGGLWLGLVSARWQKIPTPQTTPFRGTLAWHHLAGMVSGVALLLWTLSGLLSMDPWGFLASSSANAEREQLRWQVRPTSDPGASSPPKADLSTVAHLAVDAAPPNTVSIHIAPFAGQLAAIATAVDGKKTRFDQHGRPAPLSRLELEHAAKALLPGVATSSLTWLEGPDAFYFSHHTKVVFPTLRLIADNSERTRYYLDPLSGELLRKIDRNGRWHRWLHSGLHRLDFAQWLRARPFWDGLMLVLLAGCTLAAGAGVIAGWRGLWQRAQKRKRRRLR